MTRLEAQARKWAEWFVSGPEASESAKIIAWMAYVEGFKAAREQAAQTCDRYAKALPHSLDVSAHNLAIVIRALGTEEEETHG